MSQTFSAECPVQELMVPKRTRLGLLANTKRSSVLFSQIVERLQNLAAKPETPKARTEVDAVLACPWWGLRVNAIRTIVAWGGPSNKAWLLERAVRAPPDRAYKSKEYRLWAFEMGTAVHALASLLDDTDARWALTLAHSNLSARFAFYQYILRVPDDKFLDWLAVAIKESRGLMRVRLVNMVGRRKTLPGYLALMQAFAAEECGKVSAAAREWIATEKDRKVAKRP